MNILSWNVNSLGRRVKNGQLDWFFNEAPAMLCLQETKLKPGNSISIDGYYQYHSTSKTGWSGVAIFTKEKPLKIHDSLDGHYADYGRILQADYEDFILLNIYFPHETAKDCEHYQFYEHFLDYANELNKSNEVIICGDFNIAHRENDLENSDKEEMGFRKKQRALIDRLISYGYSDTFRIFNQDSGNYTWGNNIRGWRIDYFFVSDGIKDKIEDSYIRSDIKGSKDTPGSDHYPIGIKINI